MARERCWYKAILRVQTPDPRSQVLGRGKEEARVAGPLNRLHQVKVAAVAAVQHKGREFNAVGALGRRRREPDLDIAAHCGSKVAAGRGEDQCVDRRPEGEVVQHHASLHMAEYGLAVFVY